MRRLSFLLALICTLGVVACGGEDDDGGGESTRDARELVQRAFNTDVESARVAVAVDVEIDGPEGESETFAVKLNGPYASNGGQKLPSLDLDLRFSGGGQSLTAGLVVTEDNAFVSFGGETYEIGEELVRELNRQSEHAAEGRSTFEDFGIDVARWLRDPRVEGEEDVAGAGTTKVSGEIDARRVIEDYVGLLQEFGPLLGEDPPELGEGDAQRFAGILEESRIDLYVADDGTLRRLVLEVEFQLPEDLRDDAEGIEGGSATIDVTLSDVGEEQRIEAPEDARPIDELLGRFGLGPESLQ